MKTVLKLFFVVIAIMLWIVCATAQEQPSAPLRPNRTVGSAELYYFKEKNKARAQIRIYLIGKADDVGSSREALSMDVIFEVDGMKVTQPRYVTIALSSHAPAKSKYHNDHDLHIHTQGLNESSGMEWNTRVLSSSNLPSGGSTEIFLTPAIEYSKFIRMASAHVVAITFGKTHVILKKEDIKALNDLNQTIEK